MTRLNVHHMAEGGTPQAVIAAKCGISLRSVERVLAEPEPSREEVTVDERAGRKRPGRPRMVADSVLERIRVAGVVQMLPAQRSDLLASVHGRRKKATARREALLRVGKPAWAFLTVLTHRHPDGRWERPCDNLYALLERHRDEAMLAAFERCVLRHRYTVDDFAPALEEVA